MSEKLRKIARMLRDMQESHSQQIKEKCANLVQASVGLTLLKQKLQG